MNKTVEWLLETNNPSVRFYTLRDIIDLPENSADVIKAGSEIMKNGTVPKILSKQKDPGCWEEPERFYSAKYKGTAWQLIILAELGADGSDGRVRKACEFMLSASQNPESGGFAHRKSARTGSGLHSEVIPCLTGNMVWSLIRLGYLDDPRVRKGIEWIAAYQRFDDGDKNTGKEWPYDHLKACFGRHSCHMGAVKALKALSEIPLEKRTASVTAAIDRGVEYFLKHHIYKKSHDPGQVSKPGWLKFGFPLMYQTDILEILSILGRLGCRDKRMRDAVNIVRSKQDADGRWKLENTFNGRFQVSVEQKGRPSKWITLNALRVLKNIG